MDPRFRRAVAELNAGHTFEAHELWESVWNDAAGEEKEVCRALLQVAAGYNKLEIGNLNGARKLLDRGLALLRSFGEQAHGLDVGTFVDAVEADLRRLDMPPAAPPRLYFLD